MISCLRDRRANITSEQCRAQVMRLLGFMVEDHRVDVRLMEVRRLGRGGEGRGGEREGRAGRGRESGPYPIDWMGVLRRGGGGDGGGGVLGVSLGSMHLMWTLVQSMVGCPR